MFKNQSKYQSDYGEIKHSHAYEKFHFKGQTKGIALKYVSKGHEKYQINNQILDVHQGQFILVPEGQKYEAKANLKAKNIQGLCIDLNPLNLDTDLSKIYNNPLLFNLPFDCIYFSPLAKELHSTLESNPKNPEPSHILKNLNTQVHNFADEIFELHDRLNIQTEKIKTQRHILVKLFSSKNYIHRYFHQKIKLEQLAKFTGISKFHFLRLFKLSFHLSPHELQEKLRMEKAIDLLKNPTHQISNIAYDLGYVDLASFSKKFKKQYGFSPSKYRKMIN